MQHRHGPLRSVFFASSAPAGSRSPKGLTACPESSCLDVQAIPWTVSIGFTAIVLA